MLQVGQGACFALEAGGPLWIAGQFARQDLQGDLAVEMGVAGPIDFAHAALAE